MEEQTADQRIADVLETEVKQVEEHRVYTSSPSWGTDRYHIVEWEQYRGGLTIEQIDTNDKWSKRVQFPADEVPQLIKAVLGWYLDFVAQQQAAAKQVSEMLADQDNPF